MKRALSLADGTDYEASEFSAKEAHWRELRRNQFFGIQSLATGNGASPLRRRRLLSNLT
ncbi:hypothetical protein [Arthrobacter sp. UYCu723]